LDNKSLLSLIKAMSPPKIDFNKQNVPWQQSKTCQQNRVVNLT